MPTSAEDVSKAVLFSQAHGFELAVMGGGHGTSGASSTDGGLCINLSRMRGVTVDVASNTLIVQGGALWGDVDTAAAAHGLAAVGGTVNHTGVGGLTLGGGYGFLTPEHGMVIDNLLSVQYVLADGSIVTASKSENPDLFWAARGAGIGFGVVTEFVFQAHEQKENVWAGMLVFPREKLDELVEFANELILDESGKCLMVIAFAAPPPAFQPVSLLPLLFCTRLYKGQTRAPRASTLGRNPPLWMHLLQSLADFTPQVLLAMAFYNGTEAEGKARYAPLFNLGPLLDTTSSIPYPSVNEMFNGPNFHGLRRTMKGSAFLAPMSAVFAGGIWDSYVQLIADVPDAMATGILWEFAPFKKILEVGQTDTAFANRGAYGNVVFAPGWTDAKHDGVIREWTRTVATKTKVELERRKKEGTDVVTEQSVGEYGNYDSLGATGEVVFGVNYQRLKELKVRYDPKNVFSKGPSLVV